MAASDYHQQMVTLALMVIVSMLMTAIYFTKINPSSMNPTYRREFSTESQYQHQIEFSDGLPWNGSLIAKQRSGSCSRMQMHGVDVVRLPKQTSTQKLISQPENISMNSLRSRNSPGIAITEKVINTSTMTESNFTRQEHNEKVISTDQERIKKVSMMTSCFPKKNVVLLKTHKTGSSTIQNILYRFGDNHELIFALPKGRSNYFGGNGKFSESFVRPLPKGHQMNILANHARWNKKAFVAMMPEDTIYITILRHPATQFESLYIYYNWERIFKVPFHEFVKDPAEFCNKIGRYTSSHPLHSFRNPSLFDLGIETGSKTIGKDVMKGILHSLEKDFHLVLLMEYIEESIILLKELMCWSWEDVLFFATNSRSQNQIHEVTPEIKERLIEWNEEDWMLYKYFNETLWRKVQDYGLERMKKDKMILRKKTEEKKRKCLQGIKITSEVGTTIQRYKLSDEGSKDKTCSQMVKKALEYLYFLNDKMTRLS